MTDFVPFHQRPEWTDVKPVAQDDGPKPVCQIAYSNQFRETMDYFRAILQLDERSERALQLTAEVIALNPANYTAWHFRRQQILSLGKDVNEEVSFCDEIAVDNPKNYQVWYHRRVMVSNGADPYTELNFTSLILKEHDSDGKNYHCWAHRQWIVKTYNLWEVELRFAEEMMEIDLRNNSAWNHRYFIITSNPSGFTKELLDSEIQFTFSYINKAPNNPSPWNYLRGIVKAFDPEKKLRFQPFPQIKQKLQNDYQKFVACPHRLSLLVDLLVDEGSVESLQDAIDSCVILRDGMDALRKKYWEYRINCCLDLIKSR